MQLRDSLSELWWKIRWSSRATSPFHILAMHLPFNSWRVFFHRLRGTQIGRDVRIGHGVFLEESRPWLIEIHDGVIVGTGVIVCSHDAIYYNYDNNIPYKYARVILGKKCIICPAAIILPGVIIGECAVVAPGSVVNRNVDDHTIVGGVPAKMIMSLEEGLAKCRAKIGEYAKIAEATKYPWKLK